MSMKRKTQARDFRLRIEALEANQKSMQLCFQQFITDDTKHDRRIENQLRGLRSEQDRLEKAWRDCNDYEDKQTKLFVQAVRQRNEAREEAKKAHHAFRGACTVAGISVGLLGVVLAWQIAGWSAEAAEIQPEHEVPEIVECIPEVNIPEIPDSCPEANENELIEAALLERAHRIDNVKVTHYCCEKYPHICGTGDGITYSGREATPGVSIAVDPDVIPLDSTVMVDYGDGELVYYRADDIGPAVKGNHIDVCMETHQEALDAGIQNVTLYWVEE